MMAAKAVSLIGGKTTTTFWLYNSNVRLSVSASNTGLTVTRRRRKCSSIGVSQYARLLPSVVVVQATSEPNSREPNSSSPATLQDNLIYLLKLAVGSVVGAALIKYGSAAVPVITRPDIKVALLMISTPPLLAVLLLAQGSRKN
ncbi:hypothetical protein vseg_012984 [Gypsophila vaccaria]